MTKPLSPNFTARPSAAARARTSSIGSLAPRPAVAGIHRGLKELWTQERVTFKGYF